MEDLLAEFEKDRVDSDSEEILAVFESVQEINEELRPMGYNPSANQIYRDEEVLDYYESEDEDEENSLDDEEALDRDESDLPFMPPPALNGGLLRRHNAAIFMPLRVSSLYGWEPVCYNRLRILAAVHLESLDVYINN